MTATDDDNRAPAGGRDVVDQLRSAGALDGLFEQIDSGQVSMTGADGLLPALVKEALERGLAAELTEHLGYDKGEPTTQARGNARNGTTSKMVDSEVGPFETCGAPGPDRDLHPASGAQRSAPPGRPGCHDHQPVRRWNDGAGYPAPPGLHAQRGAQLGDHFEDHRRGRRGCPACGSAARWRSSTRWSISTRFGSRSALITGSPPARPISRSGWTWTVSSTSWVSGSRPRKEPPSGHMCAPSWPTEASRTC